MPQFDETGAASAQNVARCALMQTAGLGLVAALIGGAPAGAQPTDAAIWSTAFLVRPALCHRPLTGLL